MNTRTIRLGVLGIAALVGCNRVDTAATPSMAPTVPLSMDMPPPSTVEIHAHPSEGPHHGSLIELGKEEFHAELVHDDKSVSIYILDSAAKSAVPIDASDIVINLLHDGKPEQFKLAAMPDAGDPSGKSSRFVSKDAELAGHIDDESAKPKLNVTINGKGYRGVIEHSHEGHDHKH
ncbi:MAG: hypothetical protein SFV81_00145 [Pirellulaceae bacterium]|nr:hypothetical protein [Pirellulaceae bacterium]